jgi:hypothetical protein
VATAVYKRAAALFLTQDIDMVTDDIKCALVTSGYTPNLTLDAYFSTAVSSNYIGTPTSLTNKSVSSVAVFDADDVTFSSVASGTTNAVVIYVDGDTPGSNDYIIAYWDGISVTADGRNIIVTWNASGIFSLDAGA